MTNLTTDAHPFIPGAMLRHYKGGLYEVVGLCRIEATLETGVLYQPRQGEQGITWLRPLSEFRDQIETADGAVPRFAVITPAETAPAGR